MDRKARGEMKSAGYSSADAPEQAPAVYLPKKLSGAKVLEELGENQWQVTNEHLGSELPGISYRKTKDEGDLEEDIEGPDWKTVLVGFDEGDGWVRIDLEVDQSSPGVTSQKTRTHATRSFKKKDKTSGQAAPAVASSTPAKEAKVKATPQPSVVASSLRDPISCPVMTPEEAAAVTVPIGEVGARLREVLERNGAAIVTGVLSPEECKQHEGLFAADLSELLDQREANKASKEVQQAASSAISDVHNWPLASLQLLGELERCQLRGLPHGRFAWACRRHPNVRRCYEVIHGTDALVSSCDNSFFAPGASLEQTTNRNWPHVDHNRHDVQFYDEDGLCMSDWEVYQGIVYVWDATTSHASTTVVWCGSHLDAYNALMADPDMGKRGRKGSHFSQLAYARSADTKAALNTGWRQMARRMPMPAGSMLLWNSRTVHQGWSGGPRLAQPVCWEPAIRRNAVMRSRKLRLAALGLPSTHWASLGLPHMLVNIEMSAASKARKTDKGVELPLKPTLQVPTLLPGVNVLDMWQHFQKSDWEKALSSDMTELLERSLCTEILDAL